MAATEAADAVPAPVPSAAVTAGSGSGGEGDRAERGDEEDGDAKEDDGGIAALTGEEIDEATGRLRPAAATPAELAPDRLREFYEAERRKGLVYLSRIPPFMRPVKVRHLLEPYGDIGRIYLAPEGASSTVQ